MPRRQEEEPGLPTLHERTKKLCLRAGERHLVIKVETEEQFRKAVHLLGYGMPRM